MNDSDELDDELTISSTSDLIADLLPMEPTSEEQSEELWPEVRFDAGDAGDAEFVNIEDETLRREQRVIWIVHNINKVLKYYGMSYPVPLDEFIAKVITPHMCLLILVHAFGQTHADSSLILLVVLAQCALTFICNDSIKNFNPVTSCFTVRILFYFYFFLASTGLFSCMELPRSITTDFLAPPPASANLISAIGHILCVDFAWKHATMIVKLVVRWSFELRCCENYGWLQQRILQIVEHLSRLIRSIAPISRVIGCFRLPPAFGTLVLEVFAMNFIDHGLVLSEETGVEPKDLDNYRMCRLFLAFYAKLKVAEIACASCFVASTLLVLMSSFTRHCRKFQFKEGEDCEACHGECKSGGELRCLHRICARCIDVRSRTYCVCPICPLPFEYLYFDDVRMSGWDGHTQHFPRLF